jgi:hypothetical protein
MGYHFTLTMVAEIKETDITSVGEDVEELTSLCFVSFEK